MVPSITYAISFSLSRTTMSGLFAPSSGHVLSNCWTSQKIFALEFSAVANGGGWQYHGSKFCWFNRSYFSRRWKYMGLSILSCLALYKLSAIGVHDVRICVVDLYLSRIFCMYHRFVDRSCIFGKFVYLPAVDECCHL